MDSTQRAADSASTNLTRGLPGKRRDIIMVATWMLLTLLAGWYTDEIRPLPNPFDSATGWRWWFTPIEHNAFMRLPVIAGRLNDIATSPDGRIVVTVGDDAFIVTSDDGGTTWRRSEVNDVVTQTSPGSPATPAQRAATRWMPSLIRTADAGPVTEPYSNADVMQKTADQSGAAVDLLKQRRLQEKKLAEEQWQQRRDARASSSASRSAAASASQSVSSTASSAPSATATSRDVTNLYGVHIINPRTLVTVGDRGVVLRSVNGGRSWQRIPVDANARLNRVAFADEQVGAIVGDAGTVLITRNGGASWRDIRAGIDEPLQQIHFVGGTRWVATGQTSLWISSDQGENWRRQLPPFDMTMRLFSDFDRAGNGVVVGCLRQLPPGYGARCSMVSSTDGGANWSAVTSLSPAIPYVGADNLIRTVGVFGVHLLHHQRLLVLTRAGAMVSINTQTPNQLTRIDQTVLRHAVQDTQGALWGVGDNTVLLRSNRETNRWLPYSAPRLLPDRNAQGGYRLRVDERRSLVSDDGESWRPDSATRTVAELPQPSQPPAATAADAVATNVFYAPNGQLGFKIATDTLMRTEDGGKLWQPVVLPSTQRIEQVWWLDDTRVLLIAKGRVLLSKDAGISIAPVKYRKLPSPWLWLSGAMLLVFVTIRVRASARDESVASAASIADELASDRPLQWHDPDPSGLHDIALGVSRFLRNRRTEPPLTIAITGEWGTGKSSLMNLLSHDLQRFGYKPVWFNAWHHQSGENLLGSLLANIYEQGVPGWATLAGLDFRWSLLCIRARRFWLRLALTVFGVSLVCFSYHTLGTQVSDLWQRLVGDGNTVDFSQWTAAGGLAAIVAAMIVPALGIWRALSAFGLQPAKLIAAAATIVRSESSRQQAGARYRFAREFRDFTQALQPRPLVIFVDDLDRCRAQNVIEVLEAVNFLVSSGKCIVVIGMELGWVETCVGLEFKELAQAKAQHPTDAATSKPASVPEEQKRFACNYLEKLLNIELRVPVLSSDAAQRILTHREPVQTRGLRYQLGTWLLNLRLPAALIAGTALVVMAGYWTAQQLAWRDQSVAATTASPGAGPQPAGVTVAQDSQGANDPATPVAERTVVAALEAGAHASYSGWYSATFFAEFAALVGMVAGVLFARRHMRTEDSANFHDALRILHPWILLGGTSPRSLKRFVNHVRYLAMRFQPNSPSVSAWERFGRRVARWFGRDTSNENPGNALESVTEELLVALACFHRIDKTWIDQLFVHHQPIEPLLRRRLAHTGATDIQINELLTQLQAFDQRFPASALFADPAQATRHAKLFKQAMAAV